MKLRAAISPSKIKFNKICMNYSLRIMQLFKNHPIRTRVSTSFPSYNNDNELEWDKYLDWNEKEYNENTEIAELSLDSQQEQRHRKKKKKNTRKKKKIKDKSNIIIYSDGSKSEQNKLGADVIYTTDFVKNQSFS